MRMSASYIRVAFPPNSSTFIYFSFGACCPTFIRFISHTVFCLPKSSVRTLRAVQAQLICMQPSGAAAERQRYEK